MKMKKIVVAIGLFTLLLLPLATQAHEVSKADFEVYQQTVNRKLDSLKREVELKNLALEKSQLLYEKATQHISLTENVDSHFSGWLDYQINILAFLLGFIALVAAVLGYNAFSFNKNLQSKINELKEQAHKDVEQQTQQIKADLVRDFEARFKIHENIILSTFKKEEQLQNVMNESRVLVISSPSDKENQPYNELKSSYPHTELLHAGDQFKLPKIDLKKYDIIVVDNQDPNGHHWDFNEEVAKNELVDLLEKTKLANVAVLYYGPQSMDGGIVKTPEWQQHKAKGFANGLDTLKTSLTRVLTNR